METHRSYCPINLAVEVIGDKWTCLIIRDIMFYNRRYFNELLRLSEEGIASNILRDRLVTLEKEGMITRGRDPRDSHKQKIKYSLTEKGIDLLPLMIGAIIWSVKYQPVDQEKYIPAIDLAQAGPEAVAAFRKRLLEAHATKAGNE
jgi:DNA-binding HxlR family transcriptional regulator